MECAVVIYEAAQY